MARSTLIYVSAVVGVWLMGGAADAAEMLPKGDVNPRRLGFSFPPGAIERPDADTRVLTRDDDDQPVVARLQARVGDHVIVMLPDGRMVDRLANEVTATDRPFEPLDMQAMARQLTATKLKGFQVITSAHFLYIYNTSEEFALVTRRILDSMYSAIHGYAENQRIRVHRPELPLVVVMFRTKEEFRQYKRMPSGVMAYYDSLSNQVVMYEEVKSQDVKQELVVRQLICTIAHEGVHQILNNIGVQHRLSIWPMWLSEGLAEFFAPTGTKKEFRWEGAGQANDLRLYELEKYLHVRAAESRGELVEHTVLASKLTSTGYATAWALTHYLVQQRRKEFGEYLREVSKLGALEGPRRVVPPGITPENLSAFKLFFGEDVVDLERRVLLHIRQMPFNDPFADSKHFVVTVLHRRFRQAAVFHTRELAERWRPVMIERFSAEERGQVETQIIEFENRALAEQFAFKWRSAK